LVKRAAHVHGAEIAVTLIGVAEEVEASAVRGAETYTTPVVTGVLLLIAVAVVGHVYAVSESLVTGIVGAEVSVTTKLGRAGHAVSGAAEILDGAEIAVVATPGQERPNTLTGRRVAGITGAGISVVAIDRRLGALSGRRIAQVLRAQVSVAAVFHRTRARRYAVRSLDAEVVRGAKALIVARGTDRGGGPPALPGVITRVRSGTGIPILARASR
jgi:hypothetical protein